MLGVERWIADAVGTEQVWGCAPSGGAGGRDLAGGVSPPPARSWSIIAFCVMVKAFSRILKIRS